MVGAFRMDAASAADADMPAPTPRRTLDRRHVIDLAAERAGTAGPTWGGRGDDGGRIEHRERSLRLK